MALAQCQLLGGHGLVALDQQRPEPAWQWLSAVPPVPSTTAASLGRRFGTAQLAGVESSMARLLAVALRVMPPTKRAALAKSDPTIDMDSTDVEVYGPRKQGVAFNYKGQRAGRPHLATWAQAGVTVAADLLAGNDDVRPRATDMLRRALAAIPAELTGRRRVRADAGCDYAIAAKRNTAMWRAYAAADEHQWLPARDMPGAQVAAIDHAPQGQPDDAHTVVRRVPVNAEDISVDPRTRRRRTIPAEQLTLPLDGALWSAEQPGRRSSRHRHPRCPNPSRPTGRSSSHQACVDDLSVPPGRRAAARSPWGHHHRRRHRSRFAPRRQDRARSAASHTPGSRQVQGRPAAATVARWP